MKTARPISCIVLALLFVTSAFPQLTARKIDSLLKQYYDYGQLNGAVLVAEKGKIIYKKGFGMANMEWEIPNQPDTRFRIFSVTKQFTAALIMQLVDEGKIRLDSKVIDHLPDYRKDTGSKVTIRQLLNHTSGIPEYKNVDIMPNTAADFVKRFVNGDLEFEPGSKYRYSNGGYSILGAIIEKITGKSYDTVLKDRILVPLGMTNSGFENNLTLIKRRASGYEKKPTGYLNAPWIDMRIPYAAGSIYSTVEDLYKWDQALHEGKVLSAESMRLMFTPSLSDYGYGIRITERLLGKTGEKTKIIWHAGGFPGFNSLLSRAVDKKQTVIILDNGSHGRFHERVTDSILGILNGHIIEPPRRSIAETLYRVVAEKGADSAIAEYRKLRAEKSAFYDFSESELTSLGYQMVGMKRLKDAIRIFELNVEMFPASAFAHDTLGETYLADGQIDLALKSYRRSIELDPTNANASLIVRNLEGNRAEIDVSSFEEYVGEYQVTPSLVMTITKEGEKLFGQLTGQGKLEVKPVSPTQFTIPEVKANISFEKDSAGKVVGMILLQGSRSANAKKIK